MAVATHRAPRTRARIELPEWTTSDPLELSDRDLDVLEDQVGDRVALHYDREGQVRIRTKQFVGLLGLPDGPTLEIRPKAAGENLLPLILYASGRQLDPIALPTPATPGASIVDTLAALFLNELTVAVRSGLDKAYVEHHQPQRFLRGQLNLVRQLQRQGPLSTELECDYEELTFDTTLNQAILYAAHTLSGLSVDPGLRGDLSLWTQRLRAHVTLRPVEPMELAGIELTRLNDHYTQLFQLTRWVLEGLFVEDLRAGAHRAYSLLLDMNKIFESVVETAAKRGLGRRPGWSVTGQERTRKLLTGIAGSRPPVLKPDLVIRRDGEVVAVADAKWKTSVQNSDIYQLVAYQRTYDAPGLLIYPAQGGSMTRAYKVREGRRLELVEVPTDRPARDVQALGATIEQALRAEVESLVAH